MSTSTSIEPKAIVYAVEKTSLSARQVAAVLDLIINQECTIPFIARYRKEVTGEMDEVQIRSVQDFYEEYIEIEKRRAFVLDAIIKMEKMTPELEKQIKAASTLNQLEDLYAPYKSKKKTKAQIAKEAGLEPLAQLLLTSPLSPKELAASEGSKYINAEHKINTVEDAFKGACDILIEMFANCAPLKEEIRQLYWEQSKMVSLKKDDAESVTDYKKFQDFFEFSEPVKNLKDPKSSHRFLAMRRGMNLKVLKVDVEFDTVIACNMIKKEFFPNEEKLGAADVLRSCAKKAHDLYIHPSLDLEIKTELKKLADEAAIDVFGVNLKNLLLAPYLGSKAVLGVDPGVRTGCKIVIIDNTGKFCGDFVIYPHPPKEDIKNSKILIEAAIEQFKIEYVAIGNGTYGRETLAFFEENIQMVKDGKVKATMVSEAGASIYSASDIAREEFPDKDVTVRGSISIARRFQDPLAELVKIDPKSIGVGQYQHDVNQIRLKKSLEGVVENCVNYVGVDLNTASAPLLSYISGIGPSVAKNIVEYREQHKGLKSREELLKIPRFSKKIFEQSAGFLRIYDGENPLDATFIHPERYQTLESWVAKKSISMKDLINTSTMVDELAKDSTLKTEIGEITFNDIIKSLKAKRQDPRTEFKSVEFHKELKSIDDVKVGQWYTGVVANITNFGAFVDIGIKESGLVHISEISDTFVQNAMDKLKVGQEVKARVLDVDHDRKRISLSLKTGQAPAVQTSQSASSYSSHDKGKRSHREAPAQEIKNNAFAALKNFKIK